MKKIFLAAAIMISGALGAQAQTSLGIKGGINVATIRPLYEPNEPRIGAHVGLFASTPISGRFALQPELLYSQQGVETDRYTYTYHYLNIPLIFKGTLSGGLHLQVGPQFGVLLASNRKEGKSSLDITESMNRYDGALALGLGYDVAEWQISARYNFGLSDIRETKNGDLNLGRGDNLTNDVFQFSLGYRFR
ncbi:porin family protein [Rufibacter tibetensis]|uniref:Outer membrane protein beta-barrel domain-containing protein n=1 Tax=Rufibacter tibetensis TaxID=512763 RepID=A0A0P0BZR0_9BACT|nr:porin family protein [Rufibacter tibetensis]ALI97989.1 hypothetical protein DC20_02105 [Rufibacter tibetensis]